VGGGAVGGGQPEEVGVTPPDDLVGVVVEGGLEDDVDAGRERVPRAFASGDQIVEGIGRVVDLDDAQTLAAQVGEVGLLVLVAPFDEDLAHRIGTKRRAIVGLEMGEALGGEVITRGRADHIGRAEHQRPVSAMHGSIRTCSPPSLRRLRDAESRVTTIVRSSIYSPTTTVARRVKTRSSQPHSQQVAVFLGRCTQGV
jgi:hypothetical protein